MVNRNKEKTLQWSYNVMASKLQGNYKTMQISWNYETTWNFETTELLETTKISFTDIFGWYESSCKQVLSISVCNWTRTHNHLVRKLTIYHLAKSGSSQFILSSFITEFLIGENKSLSNNLWTWQHRNASTTNLEFFTLSVYLKKWYYSNVTISVLLLFKSKLFWKLSLDDESYKSLTQIWKDL